MPSALIRTVRFLNEIGLRCEPRAGAAGFVAGVVIERGALFFDDVARASNLLHEAGHLAVVPSRFRPLFNGNVSGGQKAMMAAIDFSNPDSSEARAALSCSDPEATAWAWSAGKRVGLAPEEIILDAEYGGDGPSVRAALQACCYAGIHGLAHSGFCVVRPGRLSAIRGLPAYPQLARWLQI